MCYIQVEAHQCVSQGYSDVGIKVVTTALKYGMPRGGANVIHNWCHIRLHAKQQRYQNLLDINEVFQQQTFLDTL